VRYNFNILLCVLINFVSKDMKPMQDLLSLRKYCWMRMMNSGWSIDISILLSYPSKFAKSTWLFLSDNYGGVGVNIAQWPEV